MDTTFAQRATIFALIVAAIAGAFAAHRVSTHQLENRRDARVDTAQEQIDEAINRRAFYLEDVADMIGVHDDADETEFSRYARVRAENEGSVVAVQWLRRSPTGVLSPPRETGPDPLLLAPALPGDRALADAADAPAAAEVVRTASRDKEVGISEPVELSDGNAGFYLSVPVEAQRFSGEVSRLESRSAVVGLIDAQELANGALAEELDTARLADGETELASVGDDPETPISAAVTVPGQNWSVTIEGDSLSTLERALPWLIFAFGFGLSAGVVATLRHAARRRDAAMELAGTRSAELADTLHRVERANLELEQARAEAERRSREDALIGIYNRRHFGEVLAAELERDHPGPRPGVLLLDLDHFKAINDEHGHLAGDAALQVTAQRISSTLREGDVFARWGGEEFAILAPSIDRVAAATLAERARAAVAEEPISIGGVPIALTLSVGVALAADGPSTPDALVMAADRALYDAKDAGRNRVRVWDPASSPQHAGV